LARKKSFETSAEIMRLSPLFDAEAELLAARALAADDALRFQYTDRIRERTRLREAREQEAFLRLAMKLDYRDQEATFGRLLMARRADRIAPAVLCGDQEHGLYWVYNRLRRQVPPSVEPPFVVHHSFRASAIEQSIASLTSGFARRLGLPTGAYTQ